MVGFSADSLFPARKREAVTQGVTRKIETQRGGKPREPVSSKARRTNESVITFQIHSCKTRIT